MALDEADLKDEVEMESILKNDPEQIEKGLKVIANQVNTPKGRIDLLCTDANGVLTIVELKVSSDENQLKQCIKYFDWALRNIDWLRDAYKIKIINKNPRIILVAKDFDDDIVTLARYWKEEISQITLYGYRCLLAEGKKYITCFEVLLQSPPGIQEKPKSIKDHLDYILDNEVKKNCVKTIDTIEKFSEKGLEIVPKKTGIVFKYKGRNFASIYPNRGSFGIDWRSDDEEKKWSYKTGLKKIEEINDVINQDIKKAFSLVSEEVK